ncbi:hypothetical protein PENDEC_c014G01492 [Penicillium decumbens]|uniref:AA1-like domain-containing protein n=1 Tax=Penicillium decumbens TaxID=69771 RepID=A0A1V6PA04_PENDC|nr:hypothetical protein PENDEC_c014G01492 [Penicillium decumbens]
MKFQVILAALASLAIAAPTVSPVETVKLDKVQVKNLHDVLKTQDKLQVDQTISCSISYTLDLSAGPPYTIALGSLDLTNCTYTGV